MASIQAPADGYDNHTLVAKIEKLYLKAETADVYFVFGEDDNRERVPAHKSLLAAGSDVFNAMFYGDLKEKSDVEITDASADAFKEFLQFFYRGKVNLTVENAFDVVNLGKKYDVTICQSICNRFLKDELKLSNDNVCSIYSLTTYFDLEDVKKRCQSKIVYDTEAVFESSSFLDCDRSVLSSILKLDELSCSEVSVFHACMNWAKAKAKQEKVTREMVVTYLGDSFYEIRFGSMTYEELADLTPSYGKIFPVDEYQEIVQMIRLKDFQPKKFKRNHRQVYVTQWNANQVIPCYRIEGRYHNISSFKIVEKTTFTTNKPILLGEIWCIPPIIGNVSAEMTIYEISDDGATKALYSDKNVIFTNGYSKEVALTKPILIKPGFQYDIQFKHSSATQLYYYGFDLMDKFQLPRSDIIIEFIGENKTGGIILDLGFNLITKA